MTPIGNAMPSLAAQLEQLRARARDRPAAPRPAVCQTCGGSGWEQREGAASRCRDCLPPLNERLGDAGVPAIYGEATLGAVHPQIADVALALGEWLEADGMRDGKPLSWYLYGPNGVGKTHLAAACCRVALERGWTVRFVTARDWLAELRSVYQAKRDDVDSETELQVAGRYRTARLLVLNELPRENISRPVAEAVEGLIDYRVNAGKPTIITANVGIEEVGRLYNRALASRLGPRHFEAVEMRGDDLRQS